MNGEKLEAENGVRAKENKEAEEEIQDLEEEGKDTFLAAGETQEQQIKNLRIQERKTRAKMATLANLKEVCPEVCLDQNNNNEKVWEKIIDNFESVLAFEDVVDDKKKRAALMAVAGQEIRDIFKTLDEEEPPTFDTAKEALNAYLQG